MAGNISDKAKYALREYDVRRGGGCDWYVSGYDGVEHKLQSCVYDQWGANSPAKVVRVLKEQVLAAGIKPKSYVPPPTALEEYEGTLYKNEVVYGAGKEEYEKAVSDALDVKHMEGTNIMNDQNKAAGLDKSKISTVAHLPIVLVAIAIGVLVLLLGRMK